jgi:asparagine synthase (glutamine-hydrolysing)
MCGIAGIFGTNDIDTTRSMLDCMIHRGPDDGYAVSGKDYAFGARRLSIVGLADGRQPLSNQGGDIWAAQNGELYNFPEARAFLLEKGHKLRTSCDTEIIPHLYEEFGNDFVQHIDGMFAICIWDENRRKGLLARDRMGKKPLYYFHQNGILYFASEIKCFLRLPGFQRRINLEALSYYLSFKHVPAPLTIFEGIQVLPPAHILLFDSGAITLKRYWDLDFSPGKYDDASEDELCEEMLSRLREGVKKRLMSDVPVGFFLSGGIDSSLSTALAAEICPDPVKTFTLTYEDGSTTSGKEEDKKWARWTADKYRTEHHEEVVQYKRFPDQLRRIISCFDEPFAGTVSTYFLSSLIAKHVKVAVSGDGADELFGSYLSHRLAQPLANYTTYAQSGEAQLISPFEEETERLKQLHEEEDWKWRSKLLVYREDEKLQLYDRGISGQIGKYSAERRLESDFANLTAKDPLNRVLEAEYKTIFADQVLAFVDRLSMAHSLEVRSAFLDTKLVEFVAQLPGNLKIKNGQTKYLLKKAALKYFPEQMVNRKKEGFLMPITEWLSGELEPYVRDVLSKERLAKHQLFDADAVTNLVNKLYLDKCDYTHVNKVFALVVFQEWYELYMGSTANCQAQVEPAQL